MDSPKTKPQLLRLRLAELAAVSVICSVGSLFTWWSVQRADRQMREDILQQTRLVAEAVDVARVDELSGSAADLELPEYCRLKEQLMAVRSLNSDWRFIYLVGRKSDGTVFFHLDSEPASSEDCSPPGQVYSEVSDGFRRTFQSGEPATEGPYPDRWGTWVSAIIPILDPNTGEVATVLGIDVNAHRWKRDTLRAGVMPLFLTVALLAILLSGLALQRWRKRSDAGQRAWLRYIEPGLAAAVGLVLTFGAAWTTHEAEARSRHKSFNHLAITETAAITETFRDLCEVELEGLARFFESSQQITEQEFQKYAEHLTNNPAVLAWEWIPAVSEEEKVPFEETARRNGMADFEVWERDTEGHHVPSVGRQHHYPVLYVVPSVGNEQVQGFDLGSDSIRRAAIEAAARAGLITGTEPLTLIQETGDENGMLVCRPVFTGNQPKHLRGFALAVLRMGAVLNRTTGTRTKTNSSTVVVQLLQLRPNGPPVLLASKGRSDVETGHEDISCSVTRPIFACGKTYAAVARPTTEFLEFSPLQAGWLVALAGLVMTAAVTVVIGHNVRRRRVLERKLQKRTVAIQENEARLAATLRSIGDGVVTTDTAGRVVHVNYVAESLTGWGTAEAQGCPIEEILRIVSAETRDTVENPVHEVLRQGVTVGLANHTVLISRSGVERHIADSCAPIRSASGMMIGAVLVFRDVTEEYCHHEALRESNARLDQLAEQSRTIAWEVDAVGLYTYVSDVTESVLGYRSDELVGRMHFYDLHAESDREAFKAAAFEVFTHKEQFAGMENAVLTKDGRVVWFSTNGIPLLNADGTLQGYRGSDTDITDRKRAEDSLRESEALQRSLLDNLPAGVVIVDRVTRVIERVNTYVATLFGASVDHLMGQRCHSLMCPADDGACPVCDLGATMDNSDRVMLCADGSRLPILKTVKRIQLNGQEKLLECFVDMSERRRLERSLRDQHNLLASIIEGTNVGTWQWNVQTGEAEFNERWAEMVGYKLEELAPIGIHTWLELTHPGDLIESETTLKKHFSGILDHYDCECRMRHKNGSWIWVHDRGKVIEWTSDGKPLVMTGTHSDITGRKQAEKELQEGKQRLDIAMRGAELGAWHWDIAEDNRHFSDQTCALLGITPAAFHGTADEFFAVMPPEDQETVKAALTRTLDQDMPYETEYRAVWPDGGVHYIRARGKLSRDDAGRPLKISGVIWDVSAQKQAEADLKHTVAELESANKALEEVNQIAESATRAKSEFLANMSHEIRTPMTAILGFADVLLGEADIDCAPPERVEAIRTIQRNGQYLLELINDILDLSKIEAEKLDVERIACSPAQVLAEVMSLMRIRADAKNLPLKLEYTGGIPESIQSDPLRLRQVLINLTGNAIKFTETGSVRIVAHLQQRLGKPTLFQIDVIDTGIGLTQKQITRLFKPFSQADSSTTRKYAGTGLGLTISKRLTEMLGGDITISSEPGKGSTFSLTVETGDLEGVRLLDSLVESPIRAKLASSASIRLNCRILLAEDGPDNQRLIAFLLKKAEADVTLAENGQVAYDEALAACDRGEPFDVILMDMQMPVLDGYEATRRLRAEGYTSPILALTAHAMEGDIQKCLDAGCDAYLSKPIEREKFLATINGVVSQPKPEVIVDGPTHGAGKND